MGYEYQLSGKGVGILRRYKRRVNLRNCEIFHRNFVMLETSKIDYQRSYNKPPPSRIGPPLIHYLRGRAAASIGFRVPVSGSRSLLQESGFGFRVPVCNRKPIDAGGGGLIYPFIFCTKCVSKIFFIFRLTPLSREGIMRQLVAGFIIDRGIESHICDRG